MKNRLLIFAILLNLLPCRSQAQTVPAADRHEACKRLTALTIPDVKITEAVVISSGTSYCEVSGLIGKEIHFELLLPAQWKGIFIMGGGGGFVGTIQNAARSTVNDGCATSGTDTGHDNSKSMSADWALNNKERQINFSHLAIHRTAEVSKAVIGVYYGAPPEYSYFVGCSRGGGQAMTEAQRYPEDFDGIVAGAPAFNSPAIAAEFVQNTQAVYPRKLTDPPVISTDNLRVLHDAVLRKCDLTDGVRDGILNNPASCRFDFASLPECQGNEPGAECFTAGQINAVKAIYAGIDLGNGISYPGFPFGGENKPEGWRSWITGPNAQFLQRSGYPTVQSYFGIEIFRYFILQDPAWDYSAYDFKNHEKEIRYLSEHIETVSTDYSGFKKHKGKIILWHGWNDPALSAYATVGHYNAVKASDPDIGDYMRLFLLPGVLHCGGGDGPSQIDWIAIIREWVEKNHYPERLIVSKAMNGKKVMTRPVFPYPAEANYDGKGDPDEESSFAVK